MSVEEIKLALSKIEHDDLSKLIPYLIELLEKRGYKITLANEAAIWEHLAADFIKRNKQALEELAK
ncbi:hypothetical protein [Neomoorella mulderi]|uniref:Uncharacterized protein n=1 Tax=Moorella mulderi DSM 14980 TaxID=1122241 RepID=A0A151B114_9FIRM|nr:hypothetical protein [Moorella mulderi]KYH33588.1 hypothetical protein MOMUL_02940 [Moorella mulderi DSM 14980]